MKLILRGHDRRYALEQSLLNYFPSGEGGEAVSSLTRGERWLTAVTVITTDKGKARGVARAQAGFQGSADSLLKMSFFRAARRLGDDFPWGALTGIRPAKKALEIMDAAPGGDAAFAAAELVRKYSVSPQRAELAAACAERTRAARASLAPGEVSVYVGVPFCPTRCAYCSFVSAAVEKSAGLVAPYVEALAFEMSEMGAAAAKTGLRPRTVYWGGGTPTVLSAGQLSFLMKTLAGAFDLSGVTEYTVEAGRPDTVTAEKMAALREGGATRVSVNPQTLEEHVLRGIGRAHSPEDFYRAFAIVSEAGFDSVNADIIAGLPGDAPGGFSRTLGSVLALRPGNITVHTLARKRGSRLTGEGGAPSGGDERGEAGAMLDAARAALSGAGYAPYYLYRQKFMAGGFENVGWTLPGMDCLYNICMMEELHTVIALGAGGVTKLVRPEENRIERFFQCKYPLEYLGRRDKIEEHKRRLAEFAAGGVF